METPCLLFIIKYSIIIAMVSKISDTKNHLELSRRDTVFYGYLPPTSSSRNTEAQSNISANTKPSIALQPPLPNINNNLINRNFLLAALLLSTSLNLQPKAASYNHPEHLPLDPYLSLLLSHYGKFVPIYGTGRGIYSYGAVNNYHNNKPFGAYKIYDDNDS